ncbi:MAG: hypothetical protein K5656_07040, partial [Lachnospiraceae bacterium]|nr:hypothetical protein [Lachnospiraceae bacterium]
MPKYEFLNITKTVKYDSINAIVSQLRDSSINLYNKHKDGLNALSSLKSYVDSLCTVNWIGGYNSLTNQQIQELKGKYASVSSKISLLANDLKNDKDLIKIAVFKNLLNINDAISKDYANVNLFNEKDGLSLPLELHKVKKELDLGHYKNSNIKEPGFSEYLRVYEIADKKNEEKYTLTEEALVSINGDKLF